MAIHLVIDGYNLIGTEKGLRGQLEYKRNQLVRQLQRYRESKGHPITVVFDGWRSGWSNEAEEKSGGITIIFSRLGEKADSVIQRLARAMGSGCVVVTSDRELRGAAEASGAVAVYSGEFSAKLKDLDRGAAPVEGGAPEEDPLFRRSMPQEKKGNPRRLSKRERKRRERLKKL